MFILIIFACLIILFIYRAYIKKAEQHEDSEHEQSCMPSHTAEEYEAIRQARRVWDYETIEAIENHTYTGQLPKHLSLFKWSNIYPDIYHTQIAGLYYRKGVRHLAGSYFDAILKPEPTNKFDKNAIKIIHESGKHIGYVPAKETAAVRRFVGNRFPCRCNGIIHETDELDKDGRQYLLKGEINIKKPK